MVLQKLAIGWHKLPAFECSFVYGDQVSLLEQFYYLLLKFVTMHGICERCLQVIAREGIALLAPVWLILFPAHCIQNDVKNLCNAGTAANSCVIHHDTGGPAFDKLSKVFKLDGRQFAFDPCSDLPQNIRSPFERCMLFQQVVHTFGIVLEIDTCIVAVLFLKISHQLVVYDVREQSAQFCQSMTKEPVLALRHGSVNMLQ